MATDPIRLAGGPVDRAAGEHMAELFEQHGRMVYGLCRMLLRDPVEADDATQATFVSAFRSLLGGATVREPAAWLSTIARNECRTRSQARMREPLPLLDEEPGHARGPHEEVNRRIAVAEIREAIAELPEKQREAVVLRDLYGLRYDEVGAALGLSRPSVEALLFRARRRLRVSLKPLAGGALALPIAVREGIAQALPVFASTAPATGALAGGVTAGAASGGLLAKLAAAPVAAKLAAVVALGAAGSAGVAGIEHAARPGASLPTVRPAPMVVSPPRSAQQHGAGSDDARSGDGQGSALASRVADDGAGDEGGEAGHGSSAARENRSGDNVTAAEDGHEATHHSKREGGGSDAEKAASGAGGTREHGSSVGGGVTSSVEKGETQVGGDDEAPGDDDAGGETRALDQSGSTEDEPDESTSEESESSDSSDDEADDGAEPEDEDGPEAEPEPKPEEGEPPA